MHRAPGTQKCFEENILALLMHVYIHKKNLHTSSLPSFYLGKTFTAPTEFLNLAKEAKLLQCT